MTEFHPTAIAAIETLRARFPAAPFLTLGQTVLWDEPVKAAFCRILESVAPDAAMVAAVHDTDYFAKLTGLEKPDREGPEHSNAERVEKFVMLPHNDGATRDLWSAAGDLSCLFGAEVVPTRHLLAEHGVAFDRVARSDPGGADALLNREPEAWGWRALVHAGRRPLIAADGRLRDNAPALRRQLQWGFAASLQLVAPHATAAPDAAAPDAPSSGRDVAAQIEGWVNDYVEAHPDGTLSDLYRALTPRLWNLTRGAGNAGNEDEGSCAVQTGASLELFRFNRQTARLPRFGFVHLFLQPATRDAARRCYDDAVRGSGIYTLDRFGTGALPFDVVIPGRGRGTLRLHEGSLYIETEEPITLCAGCDCGSVEELADILEDRFGPGVALVGKAVALISMLAAEYIFVFHERASSYTTRTQAMNAALRAAGMTLELHPMLRLQHAAWDALQDVDAAFCLPPHLARAFGQSQISARDFAARWKTVCDEQDELRAALKACHSPRDLMALLDTRRAHHDGAAGSEPERAACDGTCADGTCVDGICSGDAHDGATASQPSHNWARSLREYAQARSVIRALRERTQVLEQEIGALRAGAREAKERASIIERSKGEDFRAVVQPLRARISDLKEAAAQRLLTPEITSAAQTLESTAATSKLSREEKRALAQQAAQRETQRQAEEEREIAALRADIATHASRRARFDADIDGERSQARALMETARAKTRERVALETSDEAAAARAAIVRLEYEAELQRLRLTRDALLVSRGLRYTNFRPTAWWFPLVSPDGRWFRRLAETATARLEEL